MDTITFRSRLEHLGGAVSAILNGVSENEARFRPAPDRWTLVEIVNHLGDEEAEDFRARLSSLTEDPARNWAEIDPFGWVTTRSYANRDFGPSVERWRKEREASLAWLASVGTIDAAVCYTGAPSGTPPLHAGDLMLSWIAHDYYHIRQITNLRWEYLESAWPPWSPAYGGPRIEQTAGGD